VRKVDSFDSGIDTKMESFRTASRSSVDEQDDGLGGGSGGCQQPQQQDQEEQGLRDDVDDTVDGNNSVAAAALVTGLPITEAERKYNRLALRLVDRLRGQDDDELCRVLVPASSTCQPLTTTTYYMHGVFDNAIRSVGATEDDLREFESDRCQATDCEQSIDALKTLVLGCIRNKLQALDKEKRILTEKLCEMQQLLDKVSAVVQRKVSDVWFVKYRLYVDELLEVLRLLLMLASRLARTGGCDIIASDDMTSTHAAAVTSPDALGGRRSVRDNAKKRQILVERFDEALALKAGIDRRRAPLDGALSESLTADELAEYRLAVDATCRVRLDVQWVEDRLDLAQRQLSAMMDSIMAASEATEC
jgi:hypothetical protein